MKKLFIILTCAIIITGCTNNEKTITNPNGKSKTYQFFTSNNYNPGKYTLKLIKDKQEITIIKTEGQIYYDSQNQIIIEKEGRKYTLNKDNKTYTIEYIVTSDNFAKEYLPENLDSLKNQKYKTGKTYQGLNRYIYEKYNYKEGITTYYFKKNKLVKIKIKTALTENEIKFISITQKIDKNKFKIPKTYQEITY